MTTRRNAVGMTPMVLAVLAVIVIATVAYVIISTQQGGSTTPSPNPGGSTSLTASSTSSEGSPTTSSTTAVGGLRLTESVNASTIAVGQSLNISVSILNTLPVTNDISAAKDWSFQGIPVALWPACYFGLPAEAVVLQGNYSLQDLGRVASVPFGYECMEAVAIDHVIFQPNSDQVNMTGVYDVTGSNGTMGPFRMADAFTTAGYWNLASLATQTNSPIIGEGQPNPPASIAFSPGVYTIAVEDEWGQTAILHVTVVSASTGSTTSSSASSSSQQSTTCIISGQPGPIFLRVISDSNQTPVAGAQVAATNEPAYCGNGITSSPANNQVTVTFTTSSSTEWYSLDSENNAGYSFVITYLGHTYTFTASLRPVSLTCATLYVPSGRTSVSMEEFQSNCNPTTTTTTSTSSSQQYASLSWDANYGAWNYEVTLSTNQIQPDQNITALFTLTNFSNRTQTVDLDEPLVLPTIYAQDGKVVWTWEPPSINEIENITAGQAISEPFTLPTSMLQAGQSYTLTTAPGFSVPGSSVDISQQLQLSQTITVA
ncbi:MAG: hypothetical protein ABSA72_04540 [Nitrososphaerales archaeon]|jgi:hypothetical protein